MVSLQRLFEWSTSQLSRFICHSELSKLYLNSGPKYKNRGLNLDHLAYASALDSRTVKSDGYKLFMHSQHALSPSSISPSNYVPEQQLEPHQVQSHHPSKEKSKLKANQCEWIFSSTMSCLSEYNSKIPKYKGCDVELYTRHLRATEIKAMIQTWKVRFKEIQDKDMNKERFEQIRVIFLCSVCLFLLFFCVFLFFQIKWKKHFNSLNIILFGYCYKQGLIKPLS